MRIETSILHHLTQDDEFARKILPFVKPEYFHDLSERVLFEKIHGFMTKYNAIPTYEALLIEAENETKITEEQHKNIVKIIDDLKTPIENTNIEWLLDETEKFCQDKAVYNAIMNSISILDGKSNLTKDALPELLKEALGVSFDTNVGHDFLEDWQERFDFYHRVEEKVPFDLELFNKITRGGFSKKSLNVFLAGTGVGKTMVMCHMAAANLMQGKNVLYLTMEMSQEKIAERVDANLLNVMLDELDTLPKDVYEKKIQKVRSKTLGKLIIKEFPPASVHAGHFRHLLNELYLKMNFKPDIIYIDYLNLCLSFRIKPTGNINMYSYVKSVAEELRGLAVEKNVPIVSATQVNRTGFTSSDPGLEDTSESFGLPATADFMAVLITSEELEKLNQIMVKQLKNRYNSLKICRRFVIGVDAPRMKLYDVEQSAQEDVLDGPVMDKTNYGERRNEEDTMKWVTKKAGRKDFSQLKV